MSNTVILTLVCPEERTDLYNKLSLLFSKYGEDGLKDCKASCSSFSKSIMTCWNMFIAACYAYQGGELKKANVIYKYVEGQLKRLYNTNDLYQETDIIHNIQQWQDGTVGGSDIEIEQWQPNDGD